MPRQDAPGIKARARLVVEAALRKQAKPVRRLMLATGRDRAPVLPEIVQIESTNICNAKCVFCPRDEMHRRQGVMSMELFRKVVDECAELGITHVRVHNYGEPFMDRRLTDKVRYAKQKGIKEVGMISNGSLITEDVARGMIEAGLDAINISVDASGREVFESTRLGLNYDKVIANIERLVRIRAELGRRRPKLILSFVRQNNSADEQAFIEHWRAIADKIHITDLHNWAGTLNRESDVNYPCYRPWLTFTVLWDGRVSLCCADFDGRTDPRRSEYVHHSGDLERRTLRPGPARPPRKRRPGHLPRLRSAAQRFPALGHQAHLTRFPLLPASSSAFFLLLSSSFFLHPFATTAQLDPSSYQAYTGRLPRQSAAQNGPGRYPKCAPVFADSSSPPASWPWAQASPASAQDLKLSMANGRVTLVAHDVPLRQILAEWARIGETKIVNGDKLAGPPITLQLVDYPEGRALDLLLREAAGYMAAPRPANSTGASVYDRIMILPTSRPPAVSASATPQPFNRNVNMMPQPMPVPVDDDDGEPNDQGPVPPPGMVPPQGSPVPGVQAVPMGVPGPQQTQPVVTMPRPGQLPQPQPAAPNPYAPGGVRPPVPGPNTRPPGGGQEGAL